MRKVLFFLVIFLAFSLRFFKLGDNPPSLYWDEASLGYNAYLVATSGYDEHGEFLPVARFIAFGDYKPPGYIYVAVPLVLVFGLNEFSVRLPSMTAGLLMVYITYFLVKELLKSKKIAMISSFLLAISSWSLQFSRAAFEAHLAALFNLLGIYFFVLFPRKKIALVFSVFFFLLSFYTFNANRIIAPLMFFGLSFLYFRTLWTNLKWFIISFIFGIFLVLPSFSYLLSRESRLRFQEVSIFNNLEPIKISNQRIAKDENSLWARIVHNRRILFAGNFLKHYFDNFTGRFLFTHGDVNPRLNSQGMGHLYIWELPFLVLGIYFLIKKREKITLILLLWILIVPIPAGTARETPHALRILSILPTYQIITAYGIWSSLVWIKRKFSPKCIIFLLSVFCFLLFLALYYYLHNYYFHYAINWSGEWQYGYKQMVEYVTKIEKDYEEVYVTPAKGRPYIYFAFYRKIPFEEFKKERIAARDWFGFWEVEALGKIKFNLKDLNEAKGKILLVATPEEFPSGYRKITTINDLAGNTVFVIGEKI